MKSKRFENLYSILAVIISLFLGIFVVECTYKMFFMDKTFYKWGDRYMLFGQEGGGTVFRNTGEIFTYHPNATIKSSTYYNIKNEWILEYEYLFRTNNLGLVQSNDVRGDVPSILLLGDSYTEGQGSAPGLSCSIKNSRRVAGNMLTGAF